MYPPNCTHQTVLMKEAMPLKLENRGQTLPILRSSGAIRSDQLLRTNRFDSPESASNKREIPDPMLPSDFHLSRKPLPVPREERWQKTIFAGMKPKS